MNKNIIGDRIKQDKEKIIEMYDYFGTDILDIAEEYTILPSTMCKHLHDWGVKIRKGDYTRERGTAKFVMKRSKELQEKMAYNTKVNNEKIKYVKMVRATSDQELVDNIINRAII